MYYRSPKTGDRPDFRNILVSLLEKKHIVLHVPVSEESLHPKAYSLGGPLMAGFELYPSLQKTYLYN